MRKVGGWNKARQMLASASPRFRKAMDQAVLQEAHLYRKEIVEGLTTGSPGGKALAPRRRPPWPRGAPAASAVPSRSSLAVICAAPSP